MVWPMTKSSKACQMGCDPSWGENALAALKLKVVLEIHAGTK